MNLKDAAGTVTACAAVVGLVYAAATKGGWIISAADAQQMTQQHVLDEAKDRELADVRLQLSLAKNRFTYLSSLSEPNAAEQLEIDLADCDAPDLLLPRCGLCSFRLSFLFQGHSSDSSNRLNTTAFQGRQARGNTDVSADLPRRTQSSPRDAKK